MISDYSGFFTFRIDPTLPQDTRRLVEETLVTWKEALITENIQWEPPHSQKIIVDFVSEGSLHQVKKGGQLILCLLDRNQGLFSFGQNLELSSCDGILEDSFDVRQLERIIEPHLLSLLATKETEFFNAGARNMRKFEQKVRSLTQNKELSSESLLDFAQSLVDLEKEMIQADDLVRVAKILKLFVKNNIEKAKFQFYTGGDLWKLTPSRNFLALPKYKNLFLGIELSWDDEDAERLVKKIFFYQTLVGFFLSRHETNDPFADENLWDGVLDGIPFPVGLLSAKGEIHQHNTLFAKLNYPPEDCLKLNARQKIVIGDIPYNIFRKDIFHLDEKKVLFVFFTESFFLKGEGSLTPSGQELGIISSSIAHELNNPIAGIQAALSLLMLDSELDEEATQTLKEMKSGATRCKQLIETFLGFSRATPREQGPQVSSPVMISYQQAQNLLRFRTVESGIRFSLEYQKHADFRHKVNLSLLTMTFYLIMGELMTLYSHQLLVASKNQIEKVIKGEIVESSQEIQIQLHELNISGLSLSKLIQNLLTIENFVLQISDYSLRFIYSPGKN
jgi:hypothetical protein